MHSRTRPKDHAPAVISNRSEQTMRTSQALLAAALSSMALAVPALATGILAISSVVKVPSTSSHPAEVLVTGTCVAGAGPVKIFFKDTATGVATKVYTASGNCGSTAATSGRTITLPASIVSPGSYVVILKQGSGTSTPFGPITLP